MLVRFSSGNPIMPRVFRRSFSKKYPKVIQDAILTTTTGTLEGTIQTDLYGDSPSTLEKIEKKVSTEHRTRIASVDTLLSAALEISPPGKETSTKAVLITPGMNMLHHSLKLAELMVTLSEQRSTPNLTFPIFKN